jgi:hypothetical protein
MFPETKQNLQTNRILRNDQLTEEIKLLKEDRIVLSEEIELLKENRENNRTHRMSYLTWMTVNPISLIIVPPVFVSLFLLFVLNSNKPLEKWKLSELTNTAPVAITSTIFVLGVLNTFSNKYYQSIQDNCDMLIVQKLKIEMDKRDAENKAERDKRDAEQKADLIRRDAERDKRDAADKAERDKRDATDKAERDKRDAADKAERDKRDEKFYSEMKELTKQLIEIKTGQARIEAIQSITPKQ